MSVIFFLYLHAPNGVAGVARVKANEKYNVLMPAEALRYFVSSTSMAENSRVTAVLPLTVALPVMYAAVLTISLRVTSIRIVSPG